MQDEAPSSPPESPAQRALFLRFLRALKRWLRSKRLIVTELAALIAASILLTVIPQRSWAPADEMARFALRSPKLYAVVHAMALDRITSSLWFLAIVFLAGCSLVAVQVDQWRAFLRLWSAPLNAQRFRHAPYRREFLRVPRSSGEPSARFKARGRLAHLGSPTFHLGLLLLVVAGTLRLLFGQMAVADLLEGETLQPKADAYAAQWGGIASRPFRLTRPLTLAKLEVTRHASGKLKDLNAQLSDGKRVHTLGINAPLSVGAELLHLSPLFGAAALVHVRRGTKSQNHALMLQPTRNPKQYEGMIAVGGDLELRMRATLTGDGSLPKTVETRLLRRGTLLKVGRLKVGRGFSFLAAGRVDLRDLRYWARIRGSRDEFLWLAFGGFGLITLGGLLAVTIIRVDSAVIIEPGPEGERVLVALRPHRLAPLFAERFEALVRAEGGRHAL